MKQKKFWQAGAVLLAATALTACGSSKKSSSSKQDLSWSVAGEITTMDPSKATDVVSFTQMVNTMEGLYRSSKNGQTPGLATSATVSKDGLTYTFNLRKSTWSDGSPVTAKDFVYSWRRTVNPKTESEYAYLFSGIKNADRIQNGKKPVSSLGIKAVGKYQLVVTLEKRMAYFKDLMAFPVFFPQQEKAVKKYGDKYGTASKYMAYNGPFVQKGWTGSNLSWKLEKNSKYWDKSSVKLNRISYSVNKTPSTAYNLYESNKLDGFGLDSNLTKQFKGKSAYHSLANGGTYYLELNEKNQNLANANIRKAISLSINRKNLTSILGGNNLPANTYTAKDLTKVNGKDYTSMIDASAKKMATYNPSLAKKYWKKGLAELGKSSLTLNLLTSDTDSAKKTGEALQSMLESNLSGLKLTVTSVPFKTRLARRENGNFQLCGSDWIADFGDPISFLELLTSTNASNYGSWKNSEYDRLIKASKATNDQNERMKDMSQAESIMLKDCGVVPVYYEDDAWMIRPNVKGWLCTRADWDFKNAYIK